MVSVDAGRDRYARDPSTPGKLRKVTREQNFQQTTRSRSGEVVIEEDLYLEGVGYVTAILLRDVLTWHLTESDDELVGNSCWGRRDTESTLGQLLISEVYASEMCELRSPAAISPCGLLSTPLPLMYRFSVHTYERSQSNKCNWIPKVHVFCHEDADTCQAWVARLQGLLDCDARRPRNLLVLVNPFGGKGRGVQEWKSVAPLFDIARVRTKVIFTERNGHAHDLMAKASEEDLNKHDGVVVVGGDGLFNEVLNGLLMKRHIARSAPKPQQVADILANSHKAGKKLQNDGLKSQDDFRSPAIMDMKNDVATGSSFDVHSPLLESLSYPAVDTSRPMTSTSASSSLLESNIQLQVVDSSAPGTEIELSSIGLVSGLNAETCETKEENSAFHTNEDDLRGSAGSKGFLSLAGLARESSLRRSILQLRIGIIPCGSTDTIAISTTGSRDTVTGALHILLGDSMPLDVMKITGWKQSSQSGEESPQVRYAASFAGYGYWGLF